MGAVMLSEYIASARNRPFRYGRHDCALFAAGWVRAKTGRDLTLGIKHRSLRDGIEQLRAAGFESHVEVAAAHLEEIPALFAARGDIAAVGGALGIVMGERIAMLEKTGLATVPLTSATRAFRV